MEGLASALHEVLAEARDAKEKLLGNQPEHQRYETHIEDLKLVLKATNVKYRSMLDDLQHQIDAFTFIIENSKEDMEKSTFYLLVNFLFKGFRLSFSL